MKRLLSKIAKDYEIALDDMKDIVYQKLDDDMVTGGKGFTWIDERGQAILDEIMPQKQLRRGIVKGKCPNRRFVWVVDREHMQKVAVRVPIKLQNRLAGKLVHFIEKKDEQGESAFDYVKI